MIRHVVTVVCVVVAVMVAARDGVGQERRPVGLEISGVAVNGEGAPLKGKYIWFLPWNAERNSTTLHYQGVRPSNPGAYADEDGRFRITVPPGFAAPGARRHHPSEAVACSA